jgi:hypothetical protein
MSARQADPGAREGVEFLRLLVQSPCVLAQVIGCSVELMLVAGQRRPAQIAPWTSPGVDVAVAVEAHHRRGLDRISEVSEVSGT